MKKIIIAAFLLLIFTRNYAQPTRGDIPGEPSQHDSYMLKAKNFTTAGWACLGGGSALVIAGILSFLHDYELFFESESRDNQATFASALVIAGAAAMITSIPMFANGALYRHKATLSVNNAPQSFNLLKNGNNVAALSLHISLGKRL